MQESEITWGRLGFNDSLVGTPRWAMSSKLYLGSDLPHEGNRDATTV